MKNLFFLTAFAVVVSFLGTAGIAEAGDQGCESGYSARGYGVPAYGGYYNRASHGSYYRSVPYSTGSYYSSSGFNIDLHSGRIGLGIGRSRYDHYRYDRRRYDRRRYGHNGWYR